MIRLRDIVPISGDQNDPARWLLLADPLGCFDPVHPRKLNIQKEQIDLFLYGQQRLRRFNSDNIKRLFLSGMVPDQLQEFFLLTYLIFTNDDHHILLPPHFPIAALLLPIIPSSRQIIILLFLRHCDTDQSIFAAFHDMPPLFQALPCYTEIDQLLHPKGDE